MEANQSLTFKPKKDFPIDVSHTRFTHYSHFPTNINIHKTNEYSQSQEKKNLILGGFDIDEGFHELIVDDENHSINYKSFAKDYKKEFANLEYAATDLYLDHGQFTHSYLVQNNKYIVVFYGNSYYNVYDMENDEWMIQNDYTKLEKHDNSFSSQSVLINDDMIIISIGDSLYFYFIGNNHITDPKLVHSHQLPKKYGSFEHHGMCLTNFVQINDDDEKESKSSSKSSFDKYKLKFVLFGGRERLPSFVLLDVLLSYNHWDSKKINVSISDELIDVDDIKCDNKEEMKMDTLKLYYFGSVCLFNCRNEPIVVIVGGFNIGNDFKMNRNICLFNCVTKKLVCHQEVCFISYNCSILAKLNIQDFKTASFSLFFVFCCCFFFHLLLLLLPNRFYHLFVNMNQPLLKTRVIQAVLSLLKNLNIVCLIFMLIMLNQM